MQPNQIVIVDLTKSIDPGLLHNAAAALRSAIPESACGPVISMSSTPSLGLSGDRTGARGAETTGPQCLNSRLANAR
jgi:hypothetical protein